MRLSYLIVFMSCSLACGCVVSGNDYATEAKAFGPLRRVPTASELASADFGPLPQGAEDIVRNVMLKTLKDPESARFCFEETRKGWTPVFAIDRQRKFPSKALPQVGHPDRTTIFGWDLHFTVNAKNAFGGYVGPRPYRAFFYQGQLAAILQPGLSADGWGDPTEDAILSWPTTVAGVPMPSPAPAGR